MKYTLEDIKAAESRFWTKVDKNGPIPKHRPELGPCWQWQAGISSDGYGSMKVPLADGSRAVVGAHRISFIMHNERVPAKEMCVCHECDNRKCVNPNHFFEGTKEDNTKDAIDKGRFVQNNFPNTDDPRMDKSGENNGRHKLTKEQVAEIRQKYIPRKYGIVKLAREYGVSKSMISYIIREENWKS